MVKKIAVPVAGGVVCPHFGGAEAFALFGVAEDGKGISELTVAHPPAHERGVFPMWLRQQGVTTVLAGGMGGRASSMLAAYGIEVVTGTEESDPGALVAAYLAGRLVSSGEPCCGGGLHDCGGHDHGGGHGAPR